MEPLDLTSESCPIPLITVKLRLKSMSSGEHITVLLSDPGSCQDVPRLLTKKQIPYTQTSKPHGLELIITKP
ncbi:sulfurtransferase TusA family protein [Paraferrimonas haliotis]|uniref:sulfurtransferase TusA family protein n=1 Tax=Paraferrimonas haliotis TaxID=2013866 RepID=UPI000BA97B69|nr:sulfurtransferase TusA family protein [Paraferrimonas haliotis]